MFRGKIWKKLLITYLLMILAMFLFINYPLKFWITGKQEKKEITNLKTIESNVGVLYNRSSNMSDFKKKLEEASAFSSCRFILLSWDGIVSMDTSHQLDNRNLSVYLNSNKSREMRKTKLDGLFNTYYTALVGEMSNLHNSNYVVILQDYSKISDLVEEIIYFFNIGGLAVSAVMFVVVLGYCLYYTYLVRYLIQLTASYADGRFEGKQDRKKFSDEYQELANAIDYLAEKNEGLIEYQKTFVANISHDFRSPLTSIRGYTVAMKDGTIPYENQGKYLDIILFETDRLAGLTQNLLDLNEFDSNAVKLNMTNFNICAMVKQSAATFEAICASKKLKLRLIFSEKEIWVKADRQKIQQVLHNLIDNAIKFSEEDNRVEVMVTSREGKVYISVRDYGIGIPKDALNQVWERFYKTDLSRGKDKKGTGLGLSITKQIINAHDEKIIVDSTVGEGTEFTFTLKESEKKN